MKILFNQIGFLVNEAGKYVDLNGFAVNNGVHKSTLPQDVVEKISSGNYTIEAEQIIPINEDSLNDITSKKTIEVTEQQLDEIVNRAVSKKLAESYGQIAQAKMIASAVAETLKQQSLANRDASSPIDVTEIDTDDLLEKPVQFFAYNAHFSLLGDFRNNVSIDVPYKKPIIFTLIERVSSEKVGGKNGNQVISISMATIYSKRILEFMRGHSKYGVFFHENPETVRRGGGRLFDAMNNISSYVGYNEFRIKELCLKHNVDIVGGNIAKARAALIETIAIQKIREEDSKGTVYDVKTHGLESGNGLSVTSPFEGKYPEELLREI